MTAAVRGSIEVVGVSSEGLVPLQKRVASRCKPLDGVWTPSRCREGRAIAGVPPEVQALPHFNERSIEHRSSCAG